jgi:hypothetical protein
MLFVLSSLLGCKRKVEIQDKLNEKKIMEWMNLYVEYLEWGNIFTDTNRPYFDLADINYNDETAYHGKGCKCDSDTALKIQYLRFIYTYCCRDKDNLVNKLSLLSIQDTQKTLCSDYLSLFYTYLLRMRERYSLIQGTAFNKIFSNYMNYLNKCNLSMTFDTIGDKDKLVQDILISQVSLNNMKTLIDNFNGNDEMGLLKKLIIKYIQECPYSSSKFWLASCIEVMVRGNNTFFQNYVASLGLIPCLLYDIIYTTTDQMQILQLSFDILGELIKFNKGNFLLLNYYFVDNNEFGTFTKKVLSKNNLVDSNVFLRAIILSYNYFNIDDERMKIEKEDYFTTNCRFCRFIEENAEHIFYSLIQIIKPDDINQTNISCINTSLLILIINDRVGKLTQFLNV